MSSVENLYLHFPFCRRKCAYCALYSRAGSSSAERAQYVARILDAIPPDTSWKTIYFGGGTPALAELAPFKGRFPATAEFTVELHPLDVTPQKLEELRSIGVNRISLGVQSFDDATLQAMGRGHSAAQALAAFQLIRRAGFTNAGLDLIAGWPGDAHTLDSVQQAIDLGVDHLSLYSLILEPGTKLALDVRRGQTPLPPDDHALDAIQAAGELLAAAGIQRYEISNYARPGFECRHNLGTWRGEDYLGLGTGAHSRLGLTRLESGRPTATLTPLEDARERACFALRLAEGINLKCAAERFPALASVVPQWRETLESLISPGIVRPTAPDGFALTSRGFEVCDAVLAELA